MEIKEIVELLRQKKEQGNMVFVCGNGGNAATAEHFTNDLFSKGIRAFCLNSNVSIMTMIANDYGYEFIFQKQLETYAESDDLLIVFSCSGRSENIVNVLEISFLKTIKIFGNMKDDYAITENKHLALAHRISSQI